MTLQSVELFGTKPSLETVNLHAQAMDIDPKLLKATVEILASTVRFGNDYSDENRQRAKTIDEYIISKQRDETIDTLEVLLEDHMPNVRYSQYIERELNGIKDIENKEHRLKRYINAMAYSGKISIHNVYSDMGKFVGKENKVASLLKR